MGSGLLVWAFCRRDLASTSSGSSGRESEEPKWVGSNVLMDCWAKLAPQKQKKRKARKERAPPSPRYFLELLILQDLAWSEFGSADSKGVTGAFFGSADSIFGSAYFKELSLDDRCNMTYYTK